jgi:tRNA modification GTPase
MNNKMDLSQADAINTLINAETEAMANAASKNLNAKQSKNIDENIAMLSEIISRIQVSIDYPENRDLEEYSDETLLRMIQEMTDKVNEDIKQSETLVKIDKGITLSIVGIPNAGKSTLLNALINEDKAIVTDIEGTTRDIVESHIMINGIKVTLQDTAGIRNSDDKVESIGIEKSIESAKTADIVISLIDGTKDIEEQREYIKSLTNRKDLIEVINKNDLNKHEGISISAKEKEIDELINYLERYISEEFDLTNISSATLINETQINSYRKIVKNLNTAKELLENNNTTDVILFELEDAISELGKMKGIEIDQDYITNLFSNFCIGK